MLNCYGSPLFETLISQYGHSQGPSCDSYFHLYPEIFDGIVLCECCGNRILPLNAEWIIRKINYRYYHMPYCSDECKVAGEL